MRKVKKVEQPTIKAVWAKLWREYKTEWKNLWEKYKTIILPFVQGTFSYMWQLVYGLLEFVAKGLYGTGKIILDRLIKIIEKA